ncbi:MAG: BTAD domain-containing putative transcriptional regulator [Lysobacteraceae bacterium]
MLRIWLFGSLCVANDATGEQVTAISGRCGSLLAYLALGRGRYFSRAELLGTLWPERMASMTAGSFNTALWRLRRMVECPPFQHGELIASDRRGAIGLNGSQAIWLDIEEFEHRIASGLSRPIEQLGDRDIEDLRAGVALYKSDILMEFTDDWALREREKHRRHYLNALWRLMQLCVVRREYGEAIRYAQSILDCDALREDVHRELMQLFVLSGQRAQALRQFEVCRDMLRRELAIQPMRETLSLYRQIADSAIGGDQMAAPVMQAPLRFDFPPASPLAAFDTPQAVVDLAADRHARTSIATARQYLAAADAQLELSLRQLDS